MGARPGTGRDRWICRGAISGKSPGVGARSGSGTGSHSCERCAQPIPINSPYFFHLYALHINDPSPIDTCSFTRSRQADRSGLRCRWHRRAAAEKDSLTGWRAGYGACGRDALDRPGSRGQGESQSGPGQPVDPGARAGRQQGVRGRSVCEAGVISFVCGLCYIG